MYALESIRCLSRRAGSGSPFLRLRQAAAAVRSGLFSVFALLSLHRACSSLVVLLVGVRRVRSLSFARRKERPLRSLGAVVDAQAKAGGGSVGGAQRRKGPRRALASNLVTLRCSGRRVTMLLRGDMRVRPLI